MAATVAADNLAGILNMFKIFTNAPHVGLLLLLLRSLFKCLQNVNFRHNVICYLIEAIEQLLICLYWFNGRLANCIRKSHEYVAEIKNFWHSADTPNAQLATTQRMSHIWLKIWSASGTSSLVAWSV